MTASTLRLERPAKSRPARIGLARLTKMAFDGADFVPLWNTLIERIKADPTDANALIDLSYISQLMGNPQQGATLQSHALLNSAVFRSPCASETPRLKLLAIAAPVDIGGNTPVEFLLENSDVQLETLFIAPGLALPEPLPDHDIAIVTISDSVPTRPMLETSEALAATWPCPVLNRAPHIRKLDRDVLHTLLNGATGVEIPATARIGRNDLADLALSDVILNDILPGAGFPLIVRPSGSHAGAGLARLDAPDAVAAYLEAQPEDEFFVSRYVDYASADGQFRKYRIVFVDGVPYACHMAVCAEWKVWYLNADMQDSTGKRAEEAHFLTDFDADFGPRHAKALGEIHARIGLEYFAIDCAETKDGKLLVFEADNAAIVHNMDRADVFPYKAPQMRRIFDAFVAMLHKYARREEACAA